MSTPDSAPKASDSPRSLSARAEERFFTLDHVGVVRHFEGVDLQRMVPVVKAMLHERVARFEDAIEELRGRVTYTNIATLQSDGDLTLWLKATLMEGVGVVVDAKLFHTTEQSAEADEQLSLFVGELQERILKVA